MKRHCKTNPSLMCSILIFSLFFTGGGTAFAACPPEMSVYLKMDEAAAGSYADEISTSTGLCAGTCPVPVPTGIIGGAQGFDGLGTGIDFSDTANLNWSGSESFAIEYWVRRAPGAMSRNEVVVGRYDGSTALNWWTGILQTGVAGFVLIAANGDGGAAGDALQGTTDLRDGAWHHVAAVRNAVTGRNLLYVDGNPEDARTVVYAAGTDFASATAALNVGWHNVGGGFHFNGDVDEVALHGKALSAQEVLQHYNDGAVGLRTGYCGSDTPIRVMPLGDSITAGYTIGATQAQDQVGYRRKLINDLTGSGYNVDFVGGMQGGMNVPPAFDFDHEGHPGWRDDEVAAEIFNWLTANPADVVLLHIGTNGVQTSTADVEAILDEIDRYDPSITVVVAQIINRNNFDATTRRFNNNLADLVSLRIAGGDRLFLLNMEERLIYPDDLADTLHPNSPGYDKMAAAWFDAMDDFLVPGITAAPRMVSIPVEYAYMGAEYDYTVNAGGNPRPAYSLVTGPAGMTIDSETGVIQWIPDATGSFQVEVTAGNASGDQTQVFDIEVRRRVIIDNGDTGTSSVGSWVPSGGAFPFGDNSLYSYNDAGASYQYQAALNGRFEVWLHWTYWSSRCDTVPVDVYDGATLLFTYEVNQLTLASQWNLLGAHDFTGDARVVIRGSLGCTSNADAVRFLSADPVSITSVEVEGPLDVDENDTAQFQLRANYSDGSDQIVIADLWTRNCPAAGSISPDGLLTTVEVDADTPCQIYAEYTTTQGLLSDTLDITIRDVVRPPEIVLDNDGTGTSSVGTWVPSGGADPIGADSLYSYDDPSASYTFEAALDGRNEVWLYWTYWSSRCTDVPVDIYDGDTLLFTHSVDQQQNAAAWNLLAAYDFSGTGRVVLRGGSGCSTNADAVKFVSVPPLNAERIEIGGPSEVPENGGGSYTLTAFYEDASSQTVPADLWSVDCPDAASISADGVLTTVEAAADTPCQVYAEYATDLGVLSDTFDILIRDTIIVPEVIVDDGDAGTSSVGAWVPSGGALPYGDGSLYSYNEPSAAYTFQTALTGSYEVWLHWTTWPSRCTNAPVEVYDGDTLLFIHYLDQQVDGGQWNLLDTYTFSGTARVVVRGETGCTTNADAVKFVETAPTVILDNGDPGTSSVGAWVPSGGAFPYGDNSLFSYDEPTAAYTFEAALNGNHDVSLYWTYWSSRCTDVPVDIYDGAALLFTHSINQQADAAQWNLLNAYTFSGTARVVVRGRAGCTSNADAVRFVSTD